MKNLLQSITIVLFVFVLGTISCGSNDTESLQKLGESVVSSLESQDIENYLSLCGTTDDEIDVFTNASYPDSLKEELKKHISKLETDRDSRDKRIKKQRTKGFYEIAQNNFWSNAEIVRVVPDSLDEQFSLKYCPKIIIYLKGHKPLQIREIGKTSKGWKIMENHPLRWQ